MKYVYYQTCGKEYELAKIYEMTHTAAMKWNGIFPDGDIKNFLEILGIKIENLKILTSLTTDRIEIPYKEGLFSLDKNEYSGTIEKEYTGR